MAALLLLCAASATPVSVGSGRPDIPTGEYYAGKTQILPTFPHTDTAVVRGAQVELMSSGPRRPARAIRISTAHTAAEPASSGYWVVGPGSWATAAAPLIATRHALGQQAEYIAVEDLLSGVALYTDSAEALREALRAAYSDGVRYVLLLGDGSHVPVRYASDVRSDTLLPLDQLQICDLYFGEFDGTWDADGDGIYGEPYDDLPDLGAEIEVGRVPVSTAAEVAAWVEKWRRYVLALGDTHYLDRTLGFAADQMRDDDSGASQAAFIGRSLPPTFQQDTTSLLESPAGFSDTPSAPWASAVIDHWNEGWGITHIYTHGRWDGFAVKTSAYNGWPKSYLLTDPNATGAHAPLESLSGPAGVVYSVACNQASFDATAALGAPAGQPCVATELLADPDGGAVAFIGYSRWGWVYTSYRVAQVFWSGIFDSSYTLGQALNMARLAFPYLRDVAYGHNVYGDPAMHIWPGAPARLALSAPAKVSAAGGSVTASGTTAGLPFPAHFTVLAADDRLLAAGTADSTGRISFSLPPLPPQALVLTVYADSLAPAQDTIYTSLAVDVTDDPVRPQSLSLVNYPNPFNADTRIDLTLPQPASAEITIYNTLGRPVYRWLSNGPMQTAEFTWNGRTNDGTPLPTGVYLARLITSSNQTLTRRLLLLK